MFQYGLLDGHVRWALISEKWGKGNVFIQEIHLDQWHTNPLFSSTTKKWNDPALRYSEIYCTVHSNVLEMHNRARNALILIRSKRSFYLQKWIYLRGLLYLLRNETFPFNLVLRLYTDCFFFNHSFSRYCENGTKSDVKNI